MIPLSYREEYTKRSFHELIRVFGNSISDSEVKLHKDVGIGSIQVLDIEEGLQIRIWDCSLLTETTITRTASATDDRSFTLVYYMTPGSFKLENCSTPPGVIDNVWNNIFMSHDKEFSVRLQPRLPLQCLSLNFTPAWLNSNIFSDVDFKDHFFLQLVDNKQPFLIFESITHNEDLVIRNLFQNRYHQSFGKFFFRSKALNLLTEFFMKIHSRNSTLQGTSLYHEKEILGAEKLITKSITTSLPDTKQMAQDLSVSESTLHRYFKRTHGKSIYEYFLEKKMSHARNLLEKTSNSVTEIAYMLGYEKVSQFIRIFKRYYGTQPGAYRQSLRRSLV